MPMSSVHNKLNRVRKPMVHITYDVQVGDATEKREIPFVLGVMGDFSGNKPTQALKPLFERKFIEIDRDNIDTVMKRMTPGLSLEVDNELDASKGEKGSMKVNLQFNGMADFEPARVAQQVPALKNLLDIRNQLQDLLPKLDVSEDLESTLEQVLKNTENLKAMARELGLPEKQGE
jgi:type VI secretion system protein ImpB